jgi:hypothetical protein
MMRDPVGSRRDRDGGAKDRSSSPISQPVKKTEVTKSFETFGGDDDISHFKRLAQVRGSMQINNFVADGQ